jgi:hypothetical protein
LRNHQDISVSKRTLKKILDTNNIYGHLKDQQMLDKGEICDELRAIAESVGEWGNKLLEEDVFTREYYRELLKLTLVYLRVVVYPFKFRKPGVF